MIDRAFAEHDADCSFHILSFSFSVGIRGSRSFVTFFKSNAKAFLTLRIKNALRHIGNIAAFAAYCLAARDGVTIFLIVDPYCQY